jgi:aspartyl-tRNA(Asn)/glutamyl-tRNA(Gln) amidotransferase subunit C
MASSISQDDVRHVARLARLAIDERHVRLFTSQLESILTYVEQINRADTSNVSPMAHASQLVNVLRDDSPEPALTVEQVLQNAPQSDGPFFKVPKIIGDDDSAG